MKVKGLSFSPEMVTALLDGRKTQTRRVLKILVDVEFDHTGMPSINDDQNYNPGDLIYVREALECGRTPDSTCYFHATSTGVPEPKYSPKYSPNYALRESYGRALWLWPGNKLGPNQMPRWASRLTLEVTTAKIEELQDISEEDARAEGIEEDVDGLFFAIPKPKFHKSSDYDYDYDYDLTETAVDAYEEWWKSLHGKASWDANPWVIVISFTVIQQNVDEVLAERKAA